MIRTTHQNSRACSQAMSVWMLLLFLPSLLVSAFILTSCDANCVFAINSNCTQNAPAPTPTVASSIPTPTVASSSPSSSPQQTLEAVCDALETSNARELYNTFDGDLQENISVKGLQFILDGNRVVDKTQACQVSNIQQYSSTATGVLIVTNIRGKSSQTQANLIIENNAWKVSGGEAEKLWQQEHS